MGLAVVVPLAGGLFFSQRLGLIGLLERFAVRLATEFGWTSLARAHGLDERIQAIYRDRFAIGRAASIHFLAWIIGVGEAGIALALMGVRPGLGSLIVLESLTFALRSAAFFVPAAAGVQEGGYVLLGAALGIGPDIALALSLLKRGRELVLGVAGTLVVASGGEPPLVAVAPGPATFSSTPSVKSREKLKSAPYDHPRS